MNNDERKAQSDSKSLFFALEFLAKSSVPVAKMTLIRSHLGDRNRIVRVLNQAIKDELVSFSRVLTEQNKKGRPSQMLTLTESGLKYYREHRSHFYYMKKKAERSVENSRWRNVPLFRKDAQLDKVPQSQEIGMILGLGNFVAYTLPEQNYVQLQEVLACAPKSWDSLERHIVIEAVRSAWLEHGVIECSFDENDDTWLVTSSSHMLEQISREGTLSKYFGKIFLQFPGWKLSQR